MAIVTGVVLFINLTAMVPFFFEYCWFLTLFLLGGGKGFFMVAPLFLVAGPTAVLWLLLDRVDREETYWVAATAGVTLLWAVVLIILFSTVGFWDCANLEAPEE